MRVGALIGVGLVILAVVDAAGQEHLLRPPGGYGPQVQQIRGKEVPVSKLHLRLPALPQGPGSMEVRSSGNVYYRSRLAPESSGFDSLHFLLRMNLDWASENYGVVKAMLIDRWQLAHGLQGIGNSMDVNPRHVPQVHRLLYDWKIPGLANLKVRVGRQRLTVDGQRSAASASWRGDWQVFDGVRLDWGTAGQSERLSYAYLVGSAWITPWYFGPVPRDDRPVHWMAASRSWPRLGRFSLSGLIPESERDPLVTGLGWRGPRPESRGGGRMGADLLVEPRTNGSGASAWHVSGHRQQGDVTLRAGLERLRRSGRRYSASPSTFRYLPSGALRGANHLFVGADRRFGGGWTGRLLVEHAWQPATGEPSVGQAAEVSLVRRDRSGGSLVFMTGLGHVEATDSVFGRTALQWTHAF